MKIEQITLRQVGYTLLFLLHLGLNITQNFIENGRGVMMRYKMFMFDTECVLDLKTDRIIFPFTKEYLEYQDWITNNPNEYSSIN